MLKLSLKILIKQPFPSGCKKSMPVIFINSNFGVKKKICFQDCKEDLSNIKWDNAVIWCLHVVCAYSVILKWQQHKIKNLWLLLRSYQATLNRQPPLSAPAGYCFEQLQEAANTVVSSETEAKRQTFLFPSSPVRWLQMFPLVIKQQKKETHTHSAPPIKAS